MEDFHVSLGCGVWRSFKNGYTITTTPLKSDDEIIYYDNNRKEKNAISSGSFDLELVKVIILKIAKEIYKKL
jgi:hypothetical protein